MHVLAKKNTCERARKTDKQRKREFKNTERS